MLPENINFEEGIVIPVDKPYGWTSSDVVRKVRVMLRWIGYRKIKVGHAGTLDPLATGLLLICIGKATKLADSLQAEEKEYIADIELGATTPSYDMEHGIDQRYPYKHITKDAVVEALKSITGEIEQMPPVYSAKQISGKRAYEYAREGLEVELKRANVTIYDTELLEYALPDERVRIRCSKGTYIRSFARDLGEALGSGGYLTGLIRTASGKYNTDECYKLEDLEKYFFAKKNNSSQI
ncbi:MAG: tRNA pseudouridine(55) synthase TruB [Rikenellaceae bacterium]|nr:tRNA pseudouridine(55) synthase TruB [Rikenellaceae bacterium]